MEMFASHSGVFIRNEFFTWYDKIFSKSERQRVIHKTKIDFSRTQDRNLITHPMSVKTHILDVIFQNTECYSDIEKLISNTLFFSRNHVNDSTEFFKYNEKQIVNCY